jgi:hypothetical protein
VRETLDDFTLPEQHLGPPIRWVVLYPPSLRHPVELVSDRDEFRVGHMPALYASVARSALAAGAPVHPDHQLVAPNSIRSEALEILLSDVRAGLRPESDALGLHERMTEVKMRLLGDRVSRRTA